MNQRSVATSADMYRKAIKVVRSCKGIPQLRVAESYSKLFLRALPEAHRQAFKVRIELIIRLQKIRLSHGHR